MIVPDASVSGAPRALKERQTPRLAANVRGMLWASAAGLCFALLNTIMRQMSLELHPMQSMFLRYSLGLAVMLPLMLRVGLGNYKTNHLRGQLWRGLVHAAGLGLWFTALPHLPLSLTTALGFTGPIFIMLGAAIFLGERMYPARWGAALIGFAGVMVIVGPRLDGGANGYYTLLMLAAAPVFAGSFLIAKWLTRYDKPTTIVAWQSLTVSVITLPFAIAVWAWPSNTQWAWFVLAGMLGSLGHWSLTRAYVVADISAAQPVKFLDLVWAAVLSYLVFGDVPAPATLIGGMVIIAATIWIARREATQARRARKQPVTG
ncbi:MAG: DMT family transporter [Burkholderiaceae bacterium]